ncbi:MAG: glycosyl hydrolase family 28 protein [Mucilaginibacter sp.]|uniref:glycoside hydrolase family 28 protein n=1 Tax=Mucilaginibacter sp. TaxID=1882438 RepID=UPI0032633F8E
MKLTLTIGICLLVLNTAIAQHTQLPKIPATSYNVKDYGALPDGKTLNTQAIQKALELAKVTGGKVIIPEGTYLCGPLTMYSKTELVLSKNAVLRLSNDIATFPVVNARCLNFIDVSKASDIKISGEGTLDGQGLVWWEATDAGTLKNRRPQMVYIAGSERIEITGIMFLNPPNTHLSLKDALEVYIHDITIKAPANSHNTDGINISARNCTIDHCTINTGDDNIAINFGNKQQNRQEPECKNIVVSNCTFGYGHGLSIGSYTSGSLSNLQVIKCTFDGTTSAIRIKTARGRGGVLDHISYTDIDIKNSRWPIFISEYYPREPKTPQEDTTSQKSAYTPVYRDILLKNITVSNAQEAIKIWGLPESPIGHIRFENVNISAKTGALIYNADQVEFDHSSIRVEKGERLTTYKANVTGFN